ncbi:fluoride efflux transporter CrcB [Nocardioides daejeonensis]|uniref:fluoride efflux transporter CrcB n=1 Tax=Nocardioides daejeonensis TaxID=1046556 RepID=UPI0019509602|nr:fluoride efflux transporter CrcB [Nocardioides daejeonensis]
MSSTRHTTLAVALGGALGATLRWAAAEHWPTVGGTFPWTTLAINVSGCLAMGVLIAFARRPGAHPLMRPFVGTGVLGGFTTYSAFGVEAQQLLEAGRPGLAAAYVGATVALALAAVSLGARLAGSREPGHA